MWKKISWALIFSFFIAGEINASQEHLNQLNKKFPYVLLGDDYGILTVNDLAANVCWVESKPFRVENKYKPYLYWQCFESKTISFDCDSDGTSDKHEGVMGLIVVEAAKDKEQHEYIEHRLWPIKECKQFIKDAAKLIKGTKHACIAGSFIEAKDDDSGQRSKIWMIERIKTKKGCEGRGCNFTKKYKQQNCPELEF